MNLDLTPDQKIFRSTTRDYLDKTVPLTRVRELGESGEGFGDDWWRQGAELGWTAMLVPEKLGGGTVSGAPLSDLVLVAEEMGRSCAPGPLTTTSAVLTALVSAGDRFSEAIADILSGDRIASWAVYEPNRGWDPATPGTTATRSGEEYRVSGTKDRVESGAQADVFLVTASSADGPVQVLVEADAPGVTVTPTWGLDIVRGFAKVEFTDVRVGPDQVVSSGEEAHRSVIRQRDTAAVLHTAEMAGATDRTFEFTLEWAFERYTFGRPLSSYQALKHRFADDKTWLEACHATTTGAAAAMDDDPATAAERVSVAKSYVGSKAPAIIQDCVQMHGGIGVTWEHDLHLFLRRVTTNRAMYGTPQEHRRRIFELMEAGAA